MVKKCECGNSIWEDAPVCFECKEALLRKVALQPRDRRRNLYDYQTDSFEYIHNAEIGGTKRRHGRLQSDDKQ